MKKLQHPCTYLSIADDGSARVAAAHGGPGPGGRAHGARVARRQRQVLRALDVLAALAEGGVIHRLDDVRHDY